MSFAANPPFDALGTSTPRPSAWRRVRIGVFSALLGLPAVLGLLGTPKPAYFIENRQLAPFPWASLEKRDIAGFTKGFEKYISDNFPLRAYLITGLNYAKFTLGSSSHKRVVVGKDGWLFVDGGGLTDYRGTLPRDEGAIQSFKAAFEARRRYVESLGARFVFAIAPQKERVYPEFLPEWVRRIGDDTRLNHFLDAVRGSGMDVLNLADPLREGKARGQLFYRYDSHWNYLGAFVAAEAIIDHLRQLNPQVPAFRRENYSFDKLAGQVLHHGLAQLNGGILLGMPILTEADTDIIPKQGWTTKEAVTFAGQKPVYTYTKDAPELPSIVVYADSFGYPLRRFLAEHFRRAVFINPFESMTDLQSLFPTDIVSNEKPDLFMYLRLEGGLLIPTANPPEVEAATER